MSLISRNDAAKKLKQRFVNWNKNGTWGSPCNCGYDDNGANSDWVTEIDIKEMVKNWEKRSANGYTYRTTPSSSSFTMDFLCHTKNPSDGTSFNFHLTYKRS